MPRILTKELNIRIQRAEEAIKDWMLSNKKSETTPEECMEVLVQARLYEYDSHGRAHYFREDLRTLRDNHRLDMFSHIEIKQTAPGRRWTICVKGVNE